MKKLLLTLLLIVSHSLLIVKAQTPFIDSLVHAISSEPDDTNKVNTLNMLSSNLWQISDYDSSIRYSNLALTLSDHLEYEKGKGFAFYNLGICYTYKSNYSLALNDGLQGLSVFIKTGRKKGLANYHNLIGNIYFDQGNYPKALEYYFKALDISIKNNDEGIGATILGNIGLIYDEQHNYSKALVYYFKALDVCRKMDYGEGQSDNLANIGVLYVDQRKYDTALQYLLQALHLSQKIDFKANEAMDLDNMGEVYTAQMKYDTALKCVLKALVINKQIGNKRQLSYTMNSLGNIYSKQKKYFFAKAYLDSALSISKQTGEKDNVKTVYENMAALDSAKGDYIAELQDNKFYNLYRDSLNSEQTLKEEMNYEAQKRDDSIQADQDKKDAIAAKEKQREVVIRNATLLGFCIVFVASGIFFIQRRRIAKEKKRSDELLLNILPSEAAEELKETGESKARDFDMVTVMFSDFKNFTGISEKLSPSELVTELNYIFRQFDNVMYKHRLEKIKTIGDSYMAAGGLPVPNQTHAKDAVSAAIEIQEFLSKQNAQRASEGKPIFEARIGINTGPVVAGIVGIKKFAYDIWGDTVNIASRMESSSEAGKINISGSTYQLVKNDFKCVYRGKIEAKHKGEIDMYFVEY